MRPFPVFLTTVVSTDQFLESLANRQFRMFSFHCLSLLRFNSRMTLPPHLFRLPHAPSLHILNDGWHFPLTALSAASSHLQTHQHIYHQLHRLQSQCLFLREMGKRHQEAGTGCKALGVPRGSNIHLGKMEAGGEAISRIQFIYLQR